MKRQSVISVPLIPCFLMDYHIYVSSVGRTNEKPLNCYLNFCHILKIHSLSNHIQMQPKSPMKPRINQIHSIQHLVLAIRRPNPVKSQKYNQNFEELVRLSRIYGSQKPGKLKMCWHRNCSFFIRKIPYNLKMNSRIIFV